MTCQKKAAADCWCNSKRQNADMSLCCSLLNCVIDVVGTLDDSIQNEDFYHFAIHINENFRIPKWRYCTYKFWRHILSQSLYMGLIYGRHLQFRFLKWPLITVPVQSVARQPQNELQTAYGHSDGIALSLFSAAEMKVVVQPASNDCLALWRLTMELTAPFLLQRM